MPVVMGREEDANVDGEGGGWGGRRMAIVMGREDVSGDGEGGGCQE